MMERKERKPYWRHTLWQMLASVVPFLVLIIVLPLYAESLNTERFLGFPLGYFLSAHGIAIIAVFTWLTEAAATAVGPPANFTVVLIDHAASSAVRG